MVTLGRIPARVTRAVLQRHAGGPRHVPLVGHDHPDLHARCQAAAAVRDPIRRHDRRRPRRRSAAASWRRPHHVQLHDADREAAPDELVPPRRPRRRRRWSSLLRFNQPVTAGRRRCRTCARQFEPHDWIAAGAARRRRSARLQDESIRPRSTALQRQGRARPAPPRTRPAPVAARADHRLGQEAVPAVARPRRARDDDRRPARELGASVECRRPVPSLAGRRRRGRHSDVHDRGRAGVLRRRLRCAARVRPRRLQSARSFRAPVTAAAVRGRAAGDRRHRRAANRRRWSKSKPRAARALRGRARRGATDLLARGRRLRSAQPPARTYAVDASTRRCGRPTARRSATRGRASSRTGTSARSPASATATACGRRAAARCCRSTRATSGTCTQWARAGRVPAS